MSTAENQTRRRVSPKRIGLMLSFLLGTPVLFIALWYALDQLNTTQPIKADIRFIGYTNGLNGVQMAQMRVVNKSNFDIARAGVGDQLHLVSTNAVRSYPISISYTGIILRPGESAVIEFPSSIMTNLWRISVLYYEYPTEGIRTLDRCLRKIGGGISTKSTVIESETVTP